MDGFAVRAADFTGEATELELVGQSLAGQTPTAVVLAGQCALINTGAPLPTGTDAVVMVEHTTMREDDRVLLRDAPSGGQHVQRRGALATAGARIASAGQVVTTGLFAALCAARVREVTAFARPRGSPSTGSG